MAADFVYDEFHVGPLGELTHWGYDGFRQLGQNPWTLAQSDRDLFGYIQEGKLYHYWKFEAAAPDKYYHHQRVAQGEYYDPDVNAPYGDWFFTGISGAIDLYVKVSLPATTTMTNVAPGGGNVQFLFDDDVAYYGTGIWIYHYDDVDSTWQWVLSSWVSGYDDGYEESAYIGLGTAALDIWFRLTWPLDGSEAMIYYALTEPTVDADWTALMPAAYPFVPNGADLPAMQMFSQGNSWVMTEDLLVSYEYFREWPPGSHDAPSLDQYQRLQGYPKVVHQLVFNRETGDFEVLAQSETLPPRPLDNPDHTLGYDGNGNLSTIDMVMGAITYRKTLNYTAGNLTGVSVWVEQ